METTIQVNCYCGKTSHRIGGRYCVQCGERLDAPKYDPPGGGSVGWEGPLEWPGHVNERMLSAEIGALPFFLGASGCYWHVGKTPGEINRKTRLPRLFPNIKKGPLLGIVSREDAAPWALLVWKRLILLYNGFSSEYKQVWRPANPNVEECYRLPGMAVVGKPGGKGPFLSIVLVLKKHEAIHIHQTLLRFERGRRADICKWGLESRRILAPLEAVRAKIITEPFVVRKNKGLAQLVVFKRTGGDLSAPVREFGEGSGIDPEENRPKLRSHIKKLPFTGFMSIRPELFYQSGHGSGAFFWSCRGDSDGEVMELLELRKSLGRSKEYQLQAWTRDCRLAQTSPFATVLDDRGETCLAFLDDDDRLRVNRRTGVILSAGLSQARINRFFPFISAGNRLWVVEYDKKELIRYDMGGDKIEYSNRATIGERFGSGRGEIFAPPVLARGKIYYLRRKKGDSSGKNIIRLEYIG